LECQCCKVASYHNYTHERYLSFIPPEALPLLLVVPIPPVIMLTMPATSSEAASWNLLMVADVIVVSSCVKLYRYQIIF